MVDFRYHLVSIIAVFLALAVGIVLGATTLKAPLIENLDNRVSSISKDRDALRTGNDLLTKRVADQTKFAKAVLPIAVAGRLRDERIVIVSTPDSASDVRNAAVDALVAAGATIAGRLSLTKKFFDPVQAQALESVAQQAASNSVVVPGTPLQHAANQLAIAVATPTRSPAPPAGGNAETKRVLSLYQDAALVTIDGDIPVRSSIVVVVAPLPPKADALGRDDQIRGANEVISALARQATAVVAVTPTGGAAPGGVLSSLRRDQNLATRVSSVDDADTPSGQTALVLSVVERIRAYGNAAGGHQAAGQYGEGPGADKPLPDLADVS